MKKLESLTEFINNGRNIFRFLDGISDEYKEDLLKVLNETCKFDYLFNSEFFKQELNPGSYENYLAYVLPAVRRVYQLVFIEEKSIFLPKNEFNNKCLELFKLNFNLKEFLEDLAQKLIKNSNKLDDFENIDKPVEIIELICQNYVSGLIKKSRINNPTKEIRNLKLSKLV